jgi:hypothetical protein
MPSLVKGSIAVVSLIEGAIVAVITIVIINLNRVERVLADKTGIIDINAPMRTKGQKKLPHHCKNAS